MDKQEKIVNMFDQIAKTYDRANRILSMGIDTIWRRRACDLAFSYYKNREVDSIVDVACGTGDMMATWEKRANSAGISVENIVGVDPSEGMVEVGKQKLSHLEFIISKATKLPQADSSVDIVSITYGIRNVLERKEAFDEFFRVLKSGGLVVILEFTKPARESTIMRLRNWYMSTVLPKLGGLISKNREAYEYLPSSIEDFLTTKKLKNELKSGGFEIEHVQGFTMEISTLFIARKP